MKKKDMIKLKRKINKEKALARQPKTIMQEYEENPRLDVWERATKYWICNDCAEKKKWIAPTWAVTCTKGLCGYCKRKDETLLTPIVDFKRGKVEAIFD